MTSRAATADQDSEISLWNCLILFKLITASPALLEGAKVRLPPMQRCRASVDDAPSLYKDAVFSRVHFGGIFPPMELNIVLTYSLLKE